MALNAIERRILIDARALLASGESHRICYAIQTAHTRMRGQQALAGAASKRLRTFVSEAIEGNFGFEDWVRLRAGRPDILADSNALRAARIAWIDWLLDEPWTDWNGGAQPLLDGESVSVRLRNGLTPDPRAADTFRWNHVDPVSGTPPFDPWAHDYDIVAYKVHYTPPAAHAHVAETFALSA